jgi:hypothetical protein
MNSLEESILKNHLHEVKPLVNSSREVQPVEQSEPYVGIFYYINSRLHLEGVPMTQATTSGYVRVYPKEHADYWHDCIVEQLPHLRPHGPDHYPRGRVVFSPQEGIFRLQADKCILQDSGVIKKIVSEMRLPESKVKLSLAEDCECAACKAERTRYRTWLDYAIDGQLYTNEEGQRLFLPWNMFPGSSHCAYVVPSAKQYAAIRKGLSRWVRLGVPVTLFSGFLAADHIRNVTGSRCMSTLIFFLVSIPFMVAFFLWLRAQCRGLKRRHVG